MKNILVIAAHPDDEVLGLGATMKKFSMNGAVVNCVILGEGITSRTDNYDYKVEEKLRKLKQNAIDASKLIGYHTIEFHNFPDNKFDSIPLLDIIKKISFYAEKHNPDTVFTHHFGDLNIDHRIVFEAVITAFRPVGNYNVKEIYCFHTPSSTEWNFKYADNVFKPNYFCDVKTTFGDKLSAMACYKDELCEYPHPRSLKALEIIAQYWGTIVGLEYVEAFELIRKID